MASNASLTSRPRGGLALPVPVVYGMYGMCIM